LILDKKWGGGEKDIIKVINLGMGQGLSTRLPTLSEMIHYYGPYIGLVLSLIIVILILQFYWFNRTLKAKNEEIKRLVEREQKLNDRILFLISGEIGYRWKDK
jgi:hypothetical protein